MADTGHGWDQPCGAAHTADEAGGRALSPWLSVWGQDSHSTQHPAGPSPGARPCQRSGGITSLSFS